MKKIVGIILIIVLVILIVLIGVRVYYFGVINQVYNAIENFRSENNRYYAVKIKNNENSKIQKEILKKNNIINRKEQKDGGEMYYEWKNFSSEQEYAIVLKNKTYSEVDPIMFSENALENLPRIIINIYSNNNFNLIEFLKIKHVFPVKYNNQKCYKIITKAETLIVSQDTYLPIFYSLKSSNSEENNHSIVETIYEFKIDEVTDEEMQLPDLTEYTNISNK